MASFAVESRSSQPYQAWAAGFDTTLAVEAGSVHQSGRTGDSATVTAQVRSYDNLDGYVVGRLWDTTWAVVREEGTWRLQSATSEELERWEAPYYPLRPRDPVSRTDNKRAGSWREPTHARDAMNPGG